MNKNSTDNKLKRQLSPMHVWAIAFGCIIGWGSFINPGKKFLPNSGVAGTAIAMLLGALVMVIIAFSYAYMVPKYPQAGGEFSFTKNCFGKTPAYLCGWFLVAAYLTNVPMNSTAIGLIVDGLDGGADILKWGFHYRIAGFDVWMGEVILASCILILFGVLNILGEDRECRERFSRPSCRNDRLLCSRSRRGRVVWDWSKVQTEWRQRPSIQTFRWLGWKDRKRVLT